MIDRAIGVAGFALALLTVFLQYKFQAVADWTLYVLYAVSFILIGLSIGLISAGGLRQKRSSPGKASLRLHIYGDHRIPELLSESNIFRWYLLWTDVRITSATPSGPSTQVISQNILFVSFENDVAITTFRVRSPDSKLPQFEVKDFNQRFAIVVFNQRVPACTLELSTDP